MDKKIVICKDCKHRETENCALYYGTIFQDFEETKFFCGDYTDDNFYCAKGERNDKIKPCPFCGAKAKVKKVGVCYTIECFHDKDCFANVLEFDILPTKEQAINAWNHQDEGLVKRIKESKITGKEFLAEAIKGDKK